MFGPKVARCGPNFCRRGQYLATIAKLVAKTNIGQFASVGGFGSRVPKIRAQIDQFGTHRAVVWPYSGCVFQTLETFGKHRPTFGQQWPNMAQSGQRLAEFGQMLDNSGQTRPTSGQQRSELAEIGLNIVSRSNCSAIVGHVWSSPGSPGVSFRGAWPHNSSATLDQLCVRSATIGPAPPLTAATTATYGCER